MAEQLNPMARFERARSRAKQETTAETQQAKDALARRYAAMGMQASGSAIKTEQQVQEAGSKQLGQRLEGIQGAEEQEVQRLDEVKQARDFAKGEREAGQAFGAEQAAIQRKFASDEAKYGREFATKQMKESQEFAKSERAAGEQFSTSMLEKQQEFQKFAMGEQAAQWREQMDLALKQFEMDAAVTEFNKKMSQSEANKKGFFEKVGDLGTSYWTNIGGRGAAKSAPGRWLGGLS
jgi:hypothetical protein